MSLGSAFLVHVKAPFHLRRDEKSNYFFTFYFPLDYPASLLSMFRFTLTICYRVDRVDYRQRERQPPPSGTSSLTPFFSPSLPPLSHYVFIRPSICPPFALLRSYLHSFNRRSRRLSRIWRLFSLPIPHRRSALYGCVFHVCYENVCLGGWIHMCA